MTYHFTETTEFDKSPHHQPLPLKHFDIVVTGDRPFFLYMLWCGPSCLLISYSFPSRTYGHGCLIPRFSFFLIFFVSGAVRLIKLTFTSRQLLNARKYIVSCRIVSYRKYVRCIQ